MRWRRLLGLAFITGCGGQAAPSGPPKALPPPPLDEAAVEAWAPAHWDFHPPAPTTTNGFAAIEDGGCVVVAEGGQRWLTAPDKSPAPKGDARPPVCPGQATASPALAGEEFVSVLKRSPTSWMFIGEGGTVYEALTPLAPFHRTTPPPEPLLQVTGAGSSLVAVTRRGALLHWEAETGWKATAALPVPVHDVALDEAGRGLGLGHPEALFTTVDGGASWSRGAGIGPVGASRVGIAKAGGLLAEGVFASVAFDPARTPALSLAQDTLARPEEASVRAGRAASAIAVLYGRADLGDGRYYEAVRPDDEGTEPWHLSRGRIEGRLETIDLPWSNECGSIKLGARGKTVITACVRAREDDIGAQIRRSDDAGTTWRELSDLRTEDTDLLGIAVAPDGTALVTGACAPGTAQDPCDPGAPILVRGDNGAARATISAIAGLRGLATAPAFSYDGRSAYVLGRRAKDGEVALFVSHDRGDTFAERPLSQGERSANSPRFQGDFDDEPEMNAGPSLDIAESSVVHASEDGSVSVTLPTASPPVHIVTDDDGRVLQMATAPVEEASIGGYGRRVIALAPREIAGGIPIQLGLGVSEESAGAVVWESLDGGVVWTEVAAPVALSRELHNGSAAITCGQSGCLFGETVSRVGWGGQNDAPRPMAGRGESSASRTAALKTPIVCEVAQNARWTRIENVYGGGLPDDNQAMRGRSVWSIPTHDRDTGVFSVVTAMLPESGEGKATIQTRRLLGPARPGSGVATRISTQMEGYAVARIRVPRGAAVGAPMPRIEVAWENFMEGLSGRRTLDGAGAIEPGDIDGDTYVTGLLSVSPGGIFVRPHADSSATFFLGKGASVDRFAYPTFEREGLRGPVGMRGNTDIAFVHGAYVGVGFAEDNRRQSEANVVLLARMTGSGDGPRSWETRATSLGSYRGDIGTLLGWTYSGLTLGVGSLVVDPQNGYARGFFSAFSADATFAEPISIPTQLDLPMQPRPCTPAERASTPRIEAPLFAGESTLLYAGTRHPVLLIDSASATREKGVLGDPELLITSAAVLHGTAASPCFAALIADTVGTQATRLIVPSNLAESWAIRVAPPKPGSGPSPKKATERAVEVRPVSCRFEPTAKLPDAIWREPGAFRMEP